MHIDNRKQHPMVREKLQPKHLIGKLIAKCSPILRILSPFGRQVFFETETDWCYSNAANQKSAGVRLHGSDHANASDNPTLGWFVHSGIIVPPSTEDREPQQGDVAEMRCAFFGAR